MANIIGVRFKKAGKIYYFDPADNEIKLHDQVIVETSRGHEMGEVVLSPTQIADSELEEPLKSVVKKADETDIAKAKEWEAREQEALTQTGRLVEKLGLPMKLLSAEYSYDGSHLTVFFSADERVDFRKLVRELNSLFRIRVELRQVGSRDETKLIGDFGRCGRALCCRTFLGEFSPVSIKMAKEQSLPLNPMRISGLCGRLLCCLGYESELYRSVKEKMPREGQKVATPAGAGSVVEVNVLKETVLVQLESGAQTDFPLSEVGLEKQAVFERREPEKKEETPSEDAGASSLPQA